MMERLQDSYVGIIDFLCVALICIIVNLVIIIIITISSNSIVIILIIITIDTQHNRFSIEEFNLFL